HSRTRTDTETTLKGCPYVWAVWRTYRLLGRGRRCSGRKEQAKALDSTDADLFRCDDEHPFARIDRMNLILLLNSDRLLALTAGAAVTRKGYASGEAAEPLDRPACGESSVR